MQVAKYILAKDKNDKTVAYLMPNDGIKEAYADCRINGESTLTFQMPIENEKWNEITPECKFEVYGREYIILKDDAIDTVREGQKKLGKVMAVESWYGLDAKYSEPYIDNSGMYTSELSVTIVSGGSDLSGGRYTVGTAAHALYALLQGTGWTIDTVDVTGIHDLETDKESILSNIKKVQEIWGGLLVWDSINKTLSLRDETWKPYNGFQIRYAKNLKHITRTQSNKLVTKLYPFGKDDLDIASVNNSKKYLENYSYTTNVYVDVYNNPDIADPTELKNMATIELERLCRPRYNYKVNIVDLRTLPEYSHEDFAIGDMVDIIDMDLSANDKVRMLRHKFAIFQPWKCELEIGDPENRLVEDLKKAFKNTDKVREVVEPTAKTALKKIVDYVPTWEEIQNAPTVLSADDIRETVVTPTWIGTLGLLVGEQIQMGSNATISWGQVTSQPFIPQTASDVGALPSNSQRLTWIGPTGIYTGTIDANNITTGTLSADRISTNISQVNKTLQLGAIAETGKAIIFGSSAAIENPLNTDTIKIGCAANILFYAPYGIGFQNGTGTIDFSNVTVTGIKARLG